MLQYGIYFQGNIPITQVFLLKSITSNDSYENLSRDKANEVQWSYLFVQKNFFETFEKTFFKLVLRIILFIYQHDVHCVKSVCIWSICGRYFPAFGLNTDRYGVFGLNTDRYGVSLSIQSECGKIRTKITLNTDTFYTAVCSNSNSCEKLHIRLQLSDIVDKNRFKSLVLLRESCDVVSLWNISKNKDLFRTMSN